MESIPNTLTRDVLNVLLERLSAQDLAEFHQLHAMRSWKTWEDCPPNEFPPLCRWINNRIRSSFRKEVEKNSPTDIWPSSPEKVITSGLLMVYHYLYCGKYKERVHLHSIFPNDVKLPSGWYENYREWMAERGLGFNQYNLWFHRIERTKKQESQAPQSLTDNYGEW